MVDWNRFQAEGNYQNEVLKKIRNDKGYRREFVEELTKKYQKVIVNYCAKRVGEDYAEEVASEVFFIAWNKIASYKPKGTIISWLIGIANNECKKFFRDVKRRSIIVNQHMEEIHTNVHIQAVETTEALLEEESHKYLVSKKLEMCLQSLRMNEREILILKFYKELSVEDLADLYGRSQVAIRKRLSRAVKNLRGCMKNDESC